MYMLSPSSPCSIHFFGGCVPQVRQQCKQVAETLTKKKHIFVLGKGYGEPVAYEVRKRVVLHMPYGR